MFNTQERDRIMLEKIKNSGKLPLIIAAAVAIIVIIIAAVVVGININKSKEANANANTNTNISETNNQEETEENDELIVIIDQEPEEIEQEQEEQPEEDKEDNDNNDAVQNVDIKYFIRVNYGQNVVTIYTKDSNGNYTVPYKAMVCSTGTATPRSGTYTMPSGTYSRGTWGMMVGNVWAQYFTRIKGSILFHSVPYTARNKWSLEYWEYDKLGTSASAGCVRLTVENAKWIYNNCPAGTKVEFYSDSNPGPLKPARPDKISEHESVRGWDPTDPDSSNPWRTYKPTTKEEIPDTNTTNNQTTGNNTTENNTTTGSNTTENNITVGGNTTGSNTTGDNTTENNTIAGSNITTEENTTKTNTSAEENE